MMCGMRARGALILSALIMVACPHNNNDNSDNSNQDNPEGAVQTGTVTIEAGGQTIRVGVEVVHTRELVAKGLMFRKKLGATRGMLFLFPKDGQQSFYMKNTYIPLDMLFINSRMEVVGIVENAEPLTLTSRRVEAPSRFVLEVNGGFCKARGIRAGARVRFEGFKLPDDGPV
jgi:uncharacterized membrane protein (UPF0127 family)